MNEKVSKTVAGTRECVVGSAVMVFAGIIMVISSQMVTQTGERLEVPHLGACTIGGRISRHVLWSVYNALRNLWRYAKGHRKRISW